MTESPKNRAKKKIASRLFYSGDHNVATDNRLNRETIKLQDKVLGDVNIYNDRMTILSYKGEESTGVIIESKEIVAVMRQLFELAWEKTK
jgi:hypothetical protein